MKKLEIHVEYLARQADESTATEILFAPIDTKVTTEWIKSHMRSILKLEVHSIVIYQTIIMEDYQ
jgi:hypothetical protein